MDPGRSNPSATSPSTTDLSTTDPNSASKPPTVFKKVDLHCKTNNSAHHTSDIREDQLIVRRGQSFLLTIDLLRPFNPESDTLTITAINGSHPSEERGTRSVFGIPKSPETSPAAIAVWRAELHESSKLQTGSVTLNVTPPPDAPTGQYSLSVRTSQTKDAKEEAIPEASEKALPEASEEALPEASEEALPEASEEVLPEASEEALPEASEEPSLGTLILLFNPWCSDDWVYLDDEDERQEYVMNEQGIVYRGGSTYIMSLRWDYGQFEEEVVEICLKMLDVNPKHKRDPADDVSARCNPIYVSRVVSAMINSMDDQGVLVGCWDGDYSDGFSPSHWDGSVDILQRWYDRNCKAVMYGQCWVFAAVMCTVLRCLGIPCRVVTNFSSAHDTDGSLSIDVFYDDYGTRYDTGDSIWNFHVWVEAWMRRPDLSEDGSYDGWQVVDPTPQEPSGGVYCCGPASINAIFSGDIQSKYDVQFVFSEVNADRIEWMIDAYGNEFKISSDTVRVGKKISTKAVGSNKRLDVTDHYKHQEGTEQERAVYEHARGILKLMWEEYEEVNTDEEYEEVNADEGTSDDATADDATAGDATAGDATAGDATSGDATAGDATSGDATAGDATAGDATAGDATAGDATAGDATSGDATAGDAAAGDATAGDATPFEATAGDVTAVEATPLEATAHEVHVPKKVSMTIIERSEVVNGEDISLKLKMRSKDQTARSFSINISIQAMRYTGAPAVNILAEHKEETLRPGKELSIPIVIPFSIYGKHLLGCDNLKVCAMATDKQDKKLVYLAEIDIVPQDPPIFITVLGPARQYHEVVVEMSFLNPIADMLENCTATISGSGLMKKHIELRLPNLKENHQVKVKLYIYPHKAGKKTLAVDFDCSAFRDIKGSCTVNVKPV